MGGFGEAEVSRVDDARLCRERGWGVGTQLIGRDGADVDIVEITAVGQQHVLGIRLFHNGDPIRRPFEQLWTFHRRAWRPVAEAKVALPDGPVAVDGGRA